MYTFNGVPQYEADDVKDLLDPFVYEIAKALSVAIPKPTFASKEDINNAFKSACVERAKYDHERSIAYGWTVSPDRMGC
jgi:hypothetical protein